MVFDSLKQGMGGRDHLDPMLIASHTLFTAREKIALLNALKAEASGAHAEGKVTAFEPEDIDSAIAHVREGVENGVGTETVLKGDY